MGEGFHRLKIAAVLLVLGLSTGVAVAAFAGASLPDPVGDVRGRTGPDLTSISVSHSSSAVRFRLRFAKAPALRVRSETTAMLMKRPATKTGKVVGRPKVVVAGRSLSSSVSRSKLGNPAWTESAVAAGREPSDQAAGGGGDLAPVHGAFHYQLRR